MVWSYVEDYVICLSSVQYYLLHWWQVGLVCFFIYYRLDSKYSEGSSCPPHSIVSHLHIHLWRTKYPRNTSFDNNSHSSHLWWLIMSHVLIVLPNSLIQFLFKRSVITHNFLTKKAKLKKLNLLKTTQLSGRSWDSTVWFQSSCFSNVVCMNCILLHT